MVLPISLPATITIPSAVPLNQIVLPTDKLAQKPSNKKSNIKKNTNQQPKKTIAPPLPTPNPPAPNVSYGTLRQVSVKTIQGDKPSVLSAAEIDAIFRSQYGQPLNPAIVKASIQKLNDLYKEKGYELAQIVSAENPTPDGKLVLIASEGIIEDIQIRFLDKNRKPVDKDGKPIKGNTRDYIITREAELKPGQIYNRKTLEKDVRRIYRLGLFEDMAFSLAPGTKDPNKVIVQIGVVEAQGNNRFFAGGTIGGNNGLAGQLGYTQTNLGGNNQSLGGEFQVGRDILFDLSYGDPWIGGDPNRTSYRINAFSSRSSSLIFEGGPTPIFLPGGTESPRINRTGGGVTFARPLSGNPYEDGGWQASLGLNYQKVDVTNVDGQRAPVDSENKPLSLSGTGQDDLFKAQLNLSKDTRDNPRQPSDGSLIRFGVDQAIPIGLGNISTTKLTAGYTQFIPVSILNFDKGPQSLSFNIQGGTALGNLAPYEAFSLGGVSSVRGYEEGGVGAGKSFIRASAEYQFPIISFLGGAFFADYGTDLGTGSEVPGNPAGSRGKPGSGFGYGAGLRINALGLPLQLNYGLNDRGEQRIQFGLSSQ
jgi:outer membrane protein insertion porin family